MFAQTRAAIADADVCLFVVDARAGVTPLDAHFAGLLRESGKPVILVVNKTEGRAGESGVLDAFALGMGDPVPVSAEHGQGMGQLQDALVEAFGLWDEEAEPGVAGDKPVQIAVVGRPNAGKSTLINRLIGEDRLLTGPEAGITRDSIAVDWHWRDRRFRVFDTAGLRRKARVEGKLEKLAVGDALRAIRFAEVVVLTLDATAPFEKQDLQIADLVESEGRGIVIVLDKWDLVEDRQATLKELRIEAERLLPQIRGVTLVPVSGLTGEGIDRLAQAIVVAHEVWNKRLPTAVLNRWLAGIIEHHPPPAVSGRRIKLRYLTQAKSRPPSFVAFCSRPEALPEAWKRYLVNALRDDFKLPGTPIRLLLRKGENPYEGRERKRPGK